MKKVILFLVFTSFFCAKYVRANLFDLKEFNLENGMRVILVENHRAPIVQHLLIYKRGAMDEPLNKGGVAHLLEHLMFRGTKKVPDSTYNDIMNKHGAESNAFTSRDLTAYHQLVDITRLELVMALEADRMQNLNFSPLAFEKERQIVFEERQQRVSNNPAARFFEMLNKFFWKDHPYAHPITGTEEEIKNLTADDVYAFYRAHYTPNNAVLVLAGDIDEKTARTLAQKYYGAIPNSQEKSETLADLVKAEKTSFEIRQTMQEIAAPRLIKQYLVPSLHEDPQTAYALMIWESYLGGGDNAYFNRALVQSGQLAGVYVSYDPLSRAGSTFSITALPFNNADAQKANELLEKTLEKAYKNLTAQAFENEKSKMLAGLVYVRDNPQETAMLVGTQAALGMPAEEIENYANNIQAVDLKTMQEAIKKIKNSPQIGLGILLAGEKL